MPERYACARIHTHTHDTLYTSVGWKRIRFSNRCFLRCYSVSTRCDATHFIHRVFVVSVETLTCDACVSIRIDIFYYITRNYINDDDVANDRENRERSRKKTNDANQYTTNSVYKTHTTSWCVYGYHPIGKRLIRQQRDRVIYVR